MEIFKFLKKKPEENNESIKKHNFEVMNGEMLKLLALESMGGNASDVEIEGKIYSCAGANGYANSETGKIVKFGNFQDVSPEVRQANKHFIFRVAFDVKKGFFKIVDFMDEENFSEKARENIQTAIERYNSKQN